MKTQDTTPPIRQAALMDELGIRVGDRKQLRDKLLGPDDWFKEGRTVWIRSSGELKLRLYKEEPKLVATIEEFRICQLPRNNRYVMIDVGGNAVPCAVRPRDRVFMSPGKSIRAQIVKDKSGVSYRDARLS